MKNIRLLSILFLCTIVISSCKKKQEDVPELDKLPAATQVGANTAGCLVNGVVLLPKTTFLGPSPYHCTYQYVKGDYFFVMAFDDESDNTIINDVLIGTDSLAIIQGQTYNLTHVFIPRSASGSYTVFSNHGNINEYSTNDKVTGQLYISHFDPVKQIVSGTFFFDAVNKQGDIVHVTDGRFDMQYTQ